MIFLSLGSNMSSKFGNRFETINLVTNMLSTSLHRSTTIKHSSFYETPSYPDQNNPKFINTIVSISFDLSNPFTKVDHIINTIFLIEKKIGRKRNKKNENKVIDIDIIDYNGKVLDFKTQDSKLIKIPHERLTLRNFVLFPLKEICPDWIHPKTGKQIDELIARLSDEDKKSILKVHY